MPAERRAQVRRTLAAAGLPVVAVDSSIRLTGDDPGPDLRRFLQLASDWDAPLVRVFGGDLDPPPARQDRLRAAARVLEQAVPLAARLGVAIGVETHDAFSASSAVAELLALLSADGVPSDLVGAVWDSHHPHRMGETPAEVYANLGPRLLLAQVKDARRAPGRGLAAGPARRGRGAGQGDARPADRRGLPALDLGGMGEALAPRDRGPRGGPPPAPGPADHVARVGPVTSGAPERGFGIVGTGVIAAMHAAAIATLPRARLAAVTDVADGAAAAFAAARGCAAEPGLDQLLARPDVDVVCVCVPSGLHAEVGVRAARAGKHLVVEKPIDVTLAAADRLIEAARAAGVALTVISQHRFDPGLIELKRLLGDGALGRLVLAEASTKWYRTQAYYDSAAWRGTWAMDGGSLMNQGIHYVDLLRWCMGPVTEVTAVCATQAHQVEVEDTALAIVRFGSGAVGTILSSTAAYPGFPQRLEITGTDGTVIVEDGRIVRRAFGAQATAGDPGEDADPGAGAVGALGGHGAAADPAAIEVASHAAQIADLLAAVEEGRAPAVDGQAGRDALEIVRAVYESARTGAPVGLTGS